MSIELTWYGHATIGLDVDGISLLVDPFFTDNPAASCQADDIQKADYILVTHGHGDHVGDSEALAKRLGSTIISNFEICGWFQNKGVEKVHPQHIGGGFQHPFGYLKMTIAHHGSGLPDGSYGGNPGGFHLFTKEGKKIYLAGDTALFQDMKLIGEEGVDYAALPIGDNFTMGPDDALRAVNFLNPGTVLPIHYNTWDLINQDAAVWASRVSKDSKSKAEVLKAGDKSQI